MTNNARSIHTGVKLNEPIVIDSNDIVEFDDVEDEEIIAISYDDYTTTQDLVKMYQQERSAFVNAVYDMHKAGEDVSAFMYNPWFPDEIKQDIEDNWQPDDADVMSDYWDPYAPMEPEAYDDADGLQYWEGDHDVGE